MFTASTLSRFPSAFQSLAPNATRWTVVCFCAEWCSVCRGFSPAYESIANEISKDAPDILFVSIDIDDDEKLTGSLDIDDFPAFAIFKERELKFLGVLKTSQNAIETQLKALQKSDRILKLPPSMKPVYQALFD